MSLTSFLKAESSAQVISAVIFFPLFAYFIEQVLPKRQRSLGIILPNNTLSAPSTPAKGLKKKNKPTSAKADAGEEGKVVEDGVDNDRRVFLKIIAGAGAGLFMMTVFAKKSEAAFFGSVPGPGTISVKDTSGSVIDPAIKTPTDGFKITEVDDTGSPAYYGFVDKTGAWFIMKEDSTATPNYSYVKGTGGVGDTFAAKWLLRGSLSYGYFDTVF